MDSTALLTVVGVALVVLFVFLTGLCVNCKGSSQPIYIRQNPRNSETSHNTLPSNRNQGFTVVRSYVDPPSFASAPHAPHQLFTPPMPDMRRISSCPSSDGGSQSDYINQNVDNDAVSYEQPPEKTMDPDYLDVLPDDPIPSQLNLASSLNSGQSYQNMVETENDDNDDDSDSQHYINVNEDSMRGQHAAHTPIGSYVSCSSDDQGSSDYVNAPNHINSTWVV